jgi:lysophospholipase L1-like esterase
MKKLVIIGDSLSMPRPDDKIQYEKTYPYLLNQALDLIYVINRSRRANDTQLQLESQNIADDIDYIKPDYVVIHLGIVDCAPRIFSRNESFLINKLRYGKPQIIKFVSKNRKAFTRIRKIQYVPLFKYVRNMKQLINIAKGHTPNIFVCNIAKTNYDNEVRSYNFAKHIQTYNEKLKELVKEECVELIDLNVYGSSILLNDGIHLNEQGNLLVFKLLLNALERFDA